MNIKITSLCIGDIYEKTTIRREFKPNSFCTTTTSIPYKKDALLIKIGNGYVDIDTIDNERKLKEKIGSCLAKIYLFQTVNCCTFYKIYFTSSNKRSTLTSSCSPVSMFFKLTVPFFSSSSPMMATYGI